MPIDPMEQQLTGPLNVSITLGKHFFLMLGLEFKFAALKVKKNYSQHDDCTSKWLKKYVQTKLFITTVINISSVLLDLGENVNCL